jgi:serine/threonine protein kinase
MILEPSQVSEIIIQSKFIHNNIMPIYEIFVDNSFRLNIVMPYCQFDFESVIEGKSDIFANVDLDRYLKVNLNYVISSITQYSYIPTYFQSC